jgi:hypothetical protein
MSSERDKHEQYKMSMLLIKHKDHQIIYEKQFKSYFSIY